MLKPTIQLQTTVSRWLNKLRGESAAPPPSPEAQPEAVIQPAPPKTDVAELAVLRLASSRNEIAERIELINAMTGTEVTAAASSVISIVDSANAHIGKVKQLASRVGAQDQSDGIQRSIQSQTSAIDTYVQTLLKKSQTHAELATEALSQVQNISGAAAAIDRLARNARILAINARVVSAHASEGARGFDVISTEMQRLSNEVASTNKLIASLAANLKEILPRMAAGSEELSDRTKTFALESQRHAEDVNRGVELLQTDLRDTLSLGDQAVESILKSSQEALSHLQFQDVVAQRLLNVDQWLQEAQVEIANAGEKPQELAAAIRPPVHVELGGGHSVEQEYSAGEVLLF